MPFDNQCFGSFTGKVAGLDLTSSSGKAGADLSFTIRGERSLKASNKPLILVDGVDCNGLTLDINPSDIESIEVLKRWHLQPRHLEHVVQMGIIIVTTRERKNRQQQSFS